MDIKRNAIQSGRPARATDARWWLRFLLIVLCFTFPAAELSKYILHYHAVHPDWTSYLWELPLVWVPFLTGVGILAGRLK